MSHHREVQQRAALVTDEAEKNLVMLESSVYAGNQKVRVPSTSFFPIAIYCYFLIYVVYDMMCDTMKGGRTCLEYALCDAPQYLLNIL